MNLTMNGPIAQIVALGVIATVAFFPSPDYLKDAINPPQKTTVIDPLSQFEGAIALDVPETASFEIIETPRDLACIPGRDAAELVDLDLCLFELAIFIAETPSVQTLTTPGEPTPVVFPDPEIEEARRALALICQTKWSRSGILADDVAQACSIATR